MHKNTVLYNIKRLIKVDVKVWLISIMGAIITAIPWFLSIFLMAFFSKYVLDSISNGNNVIVVAIVLIGILMLMRLMVIAGYYYNSKAAEKLSSILQVKIIKSYLYKNTNFNKYKVGDITTRLINDCSQNIAEFYFQGAGCTIIEPLLCGVLGMIVIAFVDIKFLVLTLVFGTVSTVISLLFTKRINKYQNIMQECNSQISVNFTEVIKGFAIIKNNNLHDIKKKEIEKQICDESYNGYKVNVLGLITTHISNLLNVLNIVCCFLLATKLHETNGFNYSNLIIIIQMQPFVSNLLGNIGGMYNYLSVISVSAIRVFEILDEMIENDYELLESINDDKHLNTVLKLENISLNINKQILDNISLTIKQGELIVVVGKSGAGKSSLLNIIAKQIKQTSGNVSLNEICLSDRAIQKNICLLQQHPTLFNSSIYDNIQIATNETIDLNTLDDCAKRVGLYDFIHSLNDGYDTIISELGTNVSGGQKQRIALMRALVSEAKVLLFDEPTSALDYESEEIVCKTLKELSKDKIVIICSHNLKVLSIATDVYVIENHNLITYENSDYKLHLA